MTKILLVEDDKSLREIYGVRLLAEGYDIITAGDGEEALAMAIKERPALIVSDVMMPKISGFDMLDILRSTTETKDIRVIMMTALSSDDQRERGVSLGADRYLVKSQVGIEDVVRAVHEVLGDAPTTSGTPSSDPSASGHLGSPSMQPVASAATDPSSTGLPQPTAPFSTPRSGSLGDRVINPIGQGQPPRDFADLMEQELGNAPKPPVMPPQPAPHVPQPAPAAAPVAPSSAPQPVAQPTPPASTAPSPQLHGAVQMPQPSAPPAPQPDSALASSTTSFEETPPQSPTPPAQ